MFMLVHWVSRPGTGWTAYMCPERWNVQMYLGSRGPLLLARGVATGILHTADAIHSIMKRATRSECYHSVLWML